jgi:hypothetical protein
MNLRLPFQIAIFVSIILAIILADHSIRSLNNFYTFKQGMSNFQTYHNKWRAEQKKVEYVPRENYFDGLQLDSDVFRFFLRIEFKKTFVKLTAKQPLSEAESKLKTFYINTKQEELDLLNSNLPESGKANEVDALLKASDGTKIRKIKLRYRGDMGYHWLHAKKSLRIKFEDGLYGMNQKINLINPPFVHSFRDVANYQISRKLGLLAPDFYPVRVFLNHEFMGVYIYLDQVDESLLRENKRMPGSIYYGDGAPYNKEGIRDLWASEKYWVKKGARNAEQKLNREDIKAFVGAVKLKSPEFYQFAETLLNKERFFTFIALDRITGTYHHDYNHNHKIYFDPYKGLFEPIQWDLNNWNNIPKKDLSLNPLLLKIKEIPMYDAEIDKKIYQFYQTKGMEELIAIYLKASADSLDDIKTDENRDMATSQHRWQLKSWYSVPYTISEFNANIENDVAALKARKKYLLRLLNESSVEYQVKKVADKHLVIYKIDGNSPVSLAFPNTEARTIHKLYNNKRYDVSTRETLYSGRKMVPRKTEMLKIFGNKDVIPVAQYYTFEFDDISDLQDITYTNSVTENSVNAHEKAFVVPPIEDFHSWSTVDADNLTKIELSGEIHVDKSLEFAKNEIVEIKPGTTFRLAPDASIFFFGKVIAIGTKEQPIKFIPKLKDKPWGAIAVQGKSASGSTFKHLVLESGSVDSKNLISYTAPFNIHDVEDFTVEDCYIGKNYIGDDAMHVAYSTGIINNCVFEGARSDALDIDIADVTVSNSVFYDSGNDALDLMTSTAQLDNNIYLRTGDKGISVGEWSTVNITDNLFVQNEIGLEIKDKSIATVDNLTFVNARDKAINLYNKNSRYDRGGRLIADKVYFSGNSSTKADNKSEASIANKFHELPELLNQKWYPTYLANRGLLAELDFIEAKHAD